MPFAKGKGRGWSEDAFSSEDGQCINELIIIIITIVVIVIIRMVIILFHHKVINLDTAVAVHAVDIALLVN